MSNASFRVRLISVAILLAFSFGGAGLRGSTSPHAAVRSLRLHGHVPTRAIADARWKGRLASDQTISMTLALPLRNPEELQVFLSRLYNPADPLYGRYLSRQEFTGRFGPTQEDCEAVAGYARSLGLTVTGTYPNRMLVDVTGPAAAVEAGFNLRLHRYQASSGREFYAPDAEPEVPDFIASRLIGVIGLTNANLRHTHSHFREATPQATANQVGSGPGGGLTPNDIARAYNLGTVTADGSGQISALFELDGYNLNDVESYAGYYGLPSPQVRNILVDGVSGRAGGGASEVTLDIELQLALAPGASILVYEGPNTDTGILHTYNQIATDNLARQISTSWGLSELESSSAILDGENAIFQQMAAQGQTIYASAGDNGAFDGGPGLSVDDPASQPYVVGTGGTRLFLNSDRSYQSESTWNQSNTARGGASGGGISAVWSIPSWQQGIASKASLGSQIMRNVPDVSLDADPQTGYSIFYRSRWFIYGGTSCASPLWAAFTARVNQQRELNGTGPLGFANPAIYQLSAKGSSADFHDIADGSTNLFYPAVTGYDDATGWGSFDGGRLLADLAPVPLVRYYNVFGQPYTNEDVAYWQTADGLWWMGDKTGKITPVAVPPWLVP